MYKKKKEVNTPSPKSLRKSVAGGKVRVANLELSLNLLLAGGWIIECCICTDPDLPFQERLPTADIISVNTHPF